MLGVTVYNVLYCIGCKNIVAHTSNAGAHVQCTCHNTSYTLQDSVCGIDEEGLVFTGSSGSPSEYVLTPPFSFGSNSQSEVCSAPCLCGPGGYSDDFDSASYRYVHKNSC